LPAVLTGSQRGWAGGFFIGSAGTGLYPIFTGRFLFPGRGAVQFYQKSPGAGGERKVEGIQGPAGDVGSRRRQLGGLMGRRAGGGFL